ncbi:MAG: hypothetical protein ABJL99_07355 [Aliishimia sp.]
MAKFLLAYLGEHTPTEPDVSQATMTVWRKWFEGMGEAVVDGCNPAMTSKTVTRQSVADDGGANPVCGYSILQTDRFEAACETTKTCPMVVDAAGSVEVAEIHEM